MFLYGEQTNWRYLEDERRNNWRENTKGERFAPRPEMSPSTFPKLRGLGIIWGLQ